MKANARSVIGYRKIPFEFVRLQVTGALTNTSKKQGSVKFIVAASKPAARGVKIGPHATPNAAIILPHVAVQSCKTFFFRNFLVF